MNVEVGVDKEHTYSVNLEEFFLTKEGGMPLVSGDRFVELYTDQTLFDKMKNKPELFQDADVPVNRKKFGLTARQLANNYLAGDYEQYIFSHPLIYPFADGGFEAVKSFKFNNSLELPYEVHNQLYVPGTGVVFYSFPLGNENVLQELEKVRTRH